MTTTKQEFKPTAVLITEEAEWTDNNGLHVDPDKVTLLHYDSEDNSGWLYTRDEWENDKEPRIYRRYGEHEGLEGGERVELLPDMYVVKIDERRDWMDPVVLDRADRIFGVYVFDRRQVTHCCSLSGSYWLAPLGTQYSTRDGLTDEEDEDLNIRIMEGDAQNDEPGRYFDCGYIERIIAKPCRKHFLPSGNAGAYKIDVTAVVTDDAIAELQEANRQSEL